MFKTDVIFWPVELKLNLSKEHPKTNKIINKYKLNWDKKKKEA